MKSTFGHLSSTVAPMSRTQISSTSFSLKMRITLNGSPTYTSSAKRRVLTRRRRPSTSKTGMMRGLIGGSLNKISKQSHAKTVALLWMKLNTEDVAALDRADNRLPELVGCSHVIFRVALHFVAVREVKALLLLFTKERCIACRLHFSPP